MFSEFVPERAPNCSFFYGIKSSCHAAAILDTFVRNLFPSPSHHTNIHHTPPLKWLLFALLPPRSRSRWVCVCVCSHQLTTPITYCA